MAMTLAEVEFWLARAAWIKEQLNKK